jgi:probable HAF family extracellular repeat protein
MIFWLYGRPEMKDMLMTKYRSVVRTILLLALVTYTGVRDAAAAAPPAYHVTDLGTLGGTFSQGQDINASGQVTGESYTTRDATYHAFLWTPTTPNGASGALHDLGTLGGSYSVGYGINASGQVTGGSDTTGDTPDHAFLWTPTTPNGASGALHDLGTLGGTNSSGWDINASGQVTGGSDTTGDTSGHAFLYDGAMNDLGTLGGSSSFGTGINASGQVAGASWMTGDAKQHAFLYDGTLHDLGTLGGNYSAAWDINAGGQVVGHSDLTVDGPAHAFLYDGTMMHDLGTLDGTVSIGYGINASGQVVGNSLTSGGAYHAFLYTSGGGMVDLNSLIDPQSGWELDTAKAINDAGQITGIGLIGGQPHAFLLTPVPEPAAALMMLIGAFSLARRGRRRCGTAIERPSVEMLE